METAGKQSQESSDLVGGGGQEYGRFQDHRDLHREIRGGYTRSNARSANRVASDDEILWQKHDGRLEITEQSPVIRLNRTGEANIRARL